MNRTEQKDRAGFAFIRNQIVHSGVAPSLREIGAAVGYTSPRSVQLMIARLERKGLLRSINGVLRISARNLADAGERVIDVPVVGSVACGSPSLAAQEPEALLPISTRIARPGGHYFLLRARGDSMDKAGIQDGDFVLVRQQSTAQKGDRVVALINDEATIKRFFPDRGVVILRPDSKNRLHKPIILSEDLVIQGVVVATFPANLY